MLGAGIVHTEPKATLVQPRTAPSRPPTSAAASATTLPAALLPARRVQGALHIHERATRTRTRTNGNWASHSSSDAWRSPRCPVAPRCVNWFHHGIRRSSAAGQRASTPRTTRTQRRRGWSSRRWSGARSRCRRSAAANVELGLYYGAMSIEDFGTHPVYGVTAAYHITEDFFFQAEAGRSTAGNVPASKL